MADTITCPHCRGSGAIYVIGNKDGKPGLEPVTCVICEGKGYVPAPSPAPVTPQPNPAPPPPEFWPIVVPLVLFSLFFLFLFI